MSGYEDQRDEFRRIEEILALEQVWAEPPGRIEPQLLTSIAGSDSRPVAQVPRSRWWPRLAAGVAVATIAVFLLFGPFTDGGDEGTAFALGGTAAAPEAQGTATVGAAEAGWWIRLTLSGLEPAPAGSYYQGWVSNGDDYVSIGTFHMRDGDTVGLWSGVPMKEYPDLVVTLQKADGETGPSDEVMLTGSLGGSVGG